MAKSFGQKIDFSFGLIRGAEIKVTPSRNGCVWRLFQFPPRLWLKTIDVPTPTPHYLLPYRKS